MTHNTELAYPSSSMLLCSRKISEGQRGRVESSTQGGWAPIALTVILGTFIPFCIMHFFIHALVTCMHICWHTCTVLFLHHQCLLNLLSHYYCHALLNMSPYCYLITWDEIFHGGGGGGGLNISYSVLKYSVRGDQIFRLGEQNFS